MIGSVHQYAVYHICNRNPLKTWNIKFRKIVVLFLERHLPFHLLLKQIVVFLTYFSLDAGYELIAIYANDESEYLLFYVEYQIFYSLERNFMYDPKSFIKLWIFNWQCCLLIYYIFIKVELTKFLIILKPELGMDNVCIWINDEKCFKFLIQPEYKRKTG